MPGKATVASQFARTYARSTTKVKQRAAPTQTQNALFASRLSRAVKRPTQTANIVPSAATLPLSTSVSTTTALPVPTLSKNTAAEHEQKRLDVISQQNSEFWSQLKSREKVLADRDAEIARLKSDLQKMTTRAENAEHTSRDAHLKLEQTISDNITLTATLKAGGNADPLEWKRRYEEEHKRNEQLSWDQWVDSCRARGRDPYD